MTELADRAYYTTFACRLETADDHDHAGHCDWGWQCVICRRDLDGEPCPEHAPMLFPGLMLTECTATPRHLSWVHADDGYGAPCHTCLYDAERKAHGPCEHSHHGRWRRWTLTGKLLRAGSKLGVVKSWTWVSSAWCAGCVTRIRFGRSGWVLGKRREWWYCLLRRHHLMRPVPGYEWLCDICSPDPEPPGSDEQPAAATPP